MILKMKLRRAVRQILSEKDQKTLHVPRAKVTPATDDYIFTCAKKWERPRRSGASQPKPMIGGIIMLGSFGRTMGGMSGAIC